MTGTSAQLRINERNARRHRLDVATSIRAVGSMEMDFQLETLSAIGFSGQTENRFRVEDQVIVHLPILGDVAARLVWIRGGAVGGEFVRTIDADAMVAELSAP